MIEKKKEGLLVFASLHTEEQIIPVRLGTLPKNPNTSVNFFFYQEYVEVPLGFCYAMQNKNTGTQKSL